MYRGAQTTTLLGGEGERGKVGRIKAGCVNCPKNFVLHCSLSQDGLAERTDFSSPFSQSIQFTIQISFVFRLTLGPLLVRLLFKSHGVDFLSLCFCFFTLDRYNKSVPQLLIRWSVQKNYITIPKSSKPERIQENADVFDFSISDDDMKTLVRSPL